MASNSSRRTTPQQLLTEGLVAVPTSATDLQTKDCVVFQVVVTNNTAGAITFDVKDKQGTPLHLIPTISVAPNTSEIIPYPEGVKMTSGITWQAGATGLASEILGFVHS